jgi:hypothetical protein
MVVPGSFTDYSVPPLSLMGEAHSLEASHFCQAMRANCPEKRKRREEFRFPILAAISRCKHPHDFV